MCRSLERRRCTLQLGPELLRDALHEPMLARRLGKPTSSKLAIANLNEVVRSRVRMFGLGVRDELHSINSSIVCKAKFLEITFP